MTTSPLAWAVPGILAGRVAAGVKKGATFAVGVLVPRNHRNPNRDTTRPWLDPAVGARRTMNE